MIRLPPRSTRTDTPFPYTTLFRSLHGGDTTRSPAGLMLAITAFGSVPAGQILRRGGGLPGDDLYVTGSIGDAALGLERSEARRVGKECDSTGRIRCDRIK